MDKSVQTNAVLKKEEFKAFFSQIPRNWNSKYSPKLQTDNLSYSEGFLWDKHIAFLFPMQFLHERVLSVI